MLRRRPARGLAHLTAALLLTGTLTACEQVAEISEPDPRPVADDLAAGLASGELAGLPFTDASADAAGPAYTAATGELLEALAGQRPTVTVEGVDEAGGEGTATLSWSWPVAATPWTYESEAPLELVGDEWRVEWSPALVEPSLQEGELLRATEVEPERGDIMGAGGLALVTPRPVVRFGIDRGAVPPEQAVASATELARLTGIDGPAYAERVRAAGAKAFVEAITYRQDEVPPEVAQGHQALPGVLALPDEVPLAPTREFAAPILGTVGEVTAEMVQAEPDRWRPGDQAGLSGLQQRYDEQLRGRPGVVVSAVSDDPSGGDDERELFRAEPEAGEDLQLTLDADLQAETERLLAGVTPASAIVALRPSTGAILAAANGPGAGGQNIATFGQYAPGSTFKAVTSLALLRAGLQPDSVVPCTPRIVVDGKRFTNYSDYPPSSLGRIPLREAVAHSCNTSFISQADKVAGTSLFDAAVSLGMGLDHDLGFPAYFGSVEPPASATGAAADLIGQGTVLASPMVMAAVIGSVQSGQLVVPRLVESVEVAAPEGAAPLAEAEAAALRDMLRAVVTSGSGRDLADVPGPPVIAKTGTAEFGAGENLQTHAWMIGAQGDLAVAVFVEVGESGSRTAGPILEEVLRAAR